MANQAMNEQDMQMRREGYVTAAEVAEAVGKELSSIHRGIDDGRVPGKSVGPARYKKRYVDVHALLAQGDYAGSDTLTANLTALSKLVRKPDAVSKVAAAKRSSAPRPRAPAGARR